MNNLHELTKQLDVLTWNSRSVLNALIRSAMAAGSSDGFTVKRAGEDVKLTRQDIYKLYHFYEAWEATQFDEDSFDEIRANMNEEYAGTGGVDAALINHAKIMWMDADNATSTADQWIEKIKQYTNPKWLTNTAPIPINIRTPIYDENLSTKTYDSYETYLFPSAYYAIDTLGHSGDNVEHNAGGQSWHFNVDNVFAVDADRVVIGTQESAQVEAYVPMYATSPMHSIAGGENSFALKRNSFSYGSQNKVGMDESAIIGGSRNIVTGSRSGILGGINNIVGADRSSILGGQSNKIGFGPDSVAANSNNSIGGYTYTFTRTVTASAPATQTECQSIISIDGCGDYRRLENATAVVTTDGFTLDGTQVFLPYDPTAYMGMNYISAGTTTGMNSYVDFKPGDRVVLFGFTTNDGWSIRPCPSLVTNVVNIQVLTKTGLLEMSSPVSSESILGIVVTLGTTLTSDNIEGLGNYAIQKGYVVRYSSSNHPMLSIHDQPYAYGDIISYDCAAFGYNNISCGNAQFVVGTSNTELMLPRFIVGSGSSYIADSSFHRSNSLVSAPNYTYIKTSSYVVSGVATMTTAYIHGDGDTYVSTREYDEDYRDGVEKYAGFFAFSKNSNTEIDDQTRAVLRVYHEKSLLAIGDNGLVLKEPYVSDVYTPSTTDTVWNELYCKQGSIAIHSGSYLNPALHRNAEDNNWKEFYNNWVRQSPVSGQDQTITIWGNQMVGIHGYDIKLHASSTSGYIYMNAYALRIRGNTRDALTAQPTDRGIEAFTMTDSRIDVITDSGHFYSTKAAANISSRDPDIGLVVQNRKLGAFHVMTSSKFVDSGEYDVAQILLPGNIKCTRADRGTPELPHPIVMSYKVRKDGVSNTVNGRDLGTGYLYEELAYKSDISTQLNTVVCTNKGIAPYNTDLATTSYKIDTDPEVSVSGDAKVVTYDSFLLSLNEDTAHYHDTTSTKTVKPSTHYTGTIIRPVSFTGYARNITDCSAAHDGEFVSYYLDGVQINPSMYMEVYDENTTKGIAYLAYSDPSVTIASGYGSNESAISTRYNANLESAQNRVLYTSKYSKGTTIDSVSDLCDVWVTAMKSDMSEVKWLPMMRNTIMTVAGGRLAIEFDLNMTLLSSYYALPVEKDTLTNNICVNDDPESGDKVLLGNGSQYIVLPLDPDVGMKIRATFSASTHVVCQLHGRVYENTFLTGFIMGRYSLSTPGHAYHRDDRWEMDYSYNTPCIILDMHGIHQVSTSGAPKWYHCHVEGVISYVG